MKKARPSDAASVSPRDVSHTNSKTSSDLGRLDCLSQRVFEASCCCAASTAPTLRCLEAEKSQRQVQEKTDEATGVRLYRKRNTRELRILQQTLV